MTFIAHKWQWCSQHHMLVDVWSLLFVEVLYAEVKISCSFIQIFFHIVVLLIIFLFTLVTFKIWQSEGLKYWLFVDQKLKYLFFLGKCAFFFLKNFLKDSQTYLAFHLLRVHCLHSNTFQQLIRMHYYVSAWNER